MPVRFIHASRGQTKWPALIWRRVAAQPIVKVLAIITGDDMVVIRRLIDIKLWQ